MRVGTLDEVGELSPIASSLACPQPHLQIARFALVAESARWGTGYYNFVEFICRRSTQLSRVRGNRVFIGSSRLRPTFCESKSELAEPGCLRRRYIRDLSAAVASLPLKKRRVGRLRDPQRDSRIGNTQVNASALPLCTNRPENLLPAAAGPDCTLFSFITCSTRPAITSPADVTQQQI